MAFLRKVAEKAGSVLLGTATPIQLEVVELWDLMSGLGQGAPQVLGSPLNGAEWWREASIQYLSGDRPWPQGDTVRWALFRNPMPPAAEHAVFRDIRDDAALPTRQVVGPRFDELLPDMRSAFVDEFPGNIRAAQPNRAPGCPAHACHAGGTRPAQAHHGGNPPQAGGRLAPSTSSMARAGSP